MERVSQAAQALLPAEVRVDVAHDCFAFGPKARNEFVGAAVAFQRSFTLSENAGAFGSKCPCGIVGRVVVVCHGDTHKDNMSSKGDSAGCLRLGFTLVTRGGRPLTPSWRNDR